VATGYDKRERVYSGSIDVVQARIWRRDPGQSAPKVLRARDQPRAQQFWPPRAVVETFGDQVAVRSDSPDLIVADRQQHEVQRERPGLAAQLTF
jgi:hypothetical protein